MVGREPKKRLTVKRCIWVVLMVALCSPGISTAFDIGPEIGVQNDWWNDNSSNKGNQFFIPIRLDVRVKEFAASVLAGYAYTYYSQGGGVSQSLSGMLDTKLNLSYEIVDMLPVDVLIGLDFNLPSGKTGYDRRDLVLFMDPDLVSITRFGEGYGINPTVTMAKEWESWVAGVAIGYVWRGEYDFSTDMRNYYPGNILNLDWEISYSFSRDWDSRLFGAYARYDKDRLNGNDFYQEGTFLLFGLGLSYSRTKWDAGFTFRSTLRSKSEFQVSPGVLSAEAENSHGNEYVADLSFRYFLSEKTMLKPYLKGLWIGENGYPSDSSWFIGKREKFSLGLTVSRFLTRRLQGELLARGFFMNDGETHFPEFRSDLDYKGFSVGGQLTGSF